MKSRFEPNGNLEEQILQDEEKIGRILRIAADAGSQAAKSIAPVRTGAYRDGIEAQVGYNEKGKLVGRVVAKDFKSHWVEKGTIKQHGRFVLRRVGEAISSPKGSFRAGR